MRSLSLYIFTFLLSLSAYSHDLCYTNGDCQKNIQTSPATQCFVAKTGVDSFGNQTCALRCMQVEIGSTCHFIDDNVYGICVSEKVKPVPRLDPSNPNRCDDAVDLFP
jgi:hypothetical protein